MFEPVVALDAQDIGVITNALLIGLASFGEVKRLISIAEIRELRGQSIPAYERPLETGGDETIDAFVHALRLVTT